MPAAAAADESKAAGSASQQKDQAQGQQQGDSTRRSSSTLTTPPAAQPSPAVWTRARKFLKGDVNPNNATLPLVLYCFMTGYTSAASFTAAYIWCGFQTGNTIQLSLALASTFSGSPRYTTFEKLDQLALVSLLSFLLGTSLGRVGDWWGNKRRDWLVFATMFQGLFCLGGSLATLYSGEPSIAESRAEPAWQNALGLTAMGMISASLGLQGYVGKRVNTQFATTVVLTTIWVELLNDPKMFTRQRVKSRDHKTSAIVALFIGGLVGRAIINSIGTPAMLGIGVAFRAVVASTWLITDDLMVWEFLRGRAKAPHKDWVA